MRAFFLLAPLALALATGCEESIYYYPDGGPPPPDAGPPPTPPTVEAFVLGGYHYQLLDFSVRSIETQIEHLSLDRTSLVLRGPLDGRDGRFELAIFVDREEGFFGPSLAPGQSLDIGTDRPAGFDGFAYLQVTDPDGTRRQADEHSSHQIELAIEEGSVPGARRFRATFYYPQTTAYWVHADFEVRPPG